MRSSVSAHQGQLPLEGGALGRCQGLLFIAPQQGNVFPLKLVSRGRQNLSSERKTTPGVLTAGGGIHRHTTFGDHGDRKRVINDAARPLYLKIHVVLTAQVNRGPDFQLIRIHRAVSSHSTQPIITNPVRLKAFLCAFSGGNSFPW